MNLPAIYTHVNVDADAVLSVIAVKKYVRGMADAVVKFRNTNWDGEGVSPLDVAVDIEAGGRGVKGEKVGDVTHSCFALLMKRFAPRDDQRILWHLIEFVDILDSQGSVIERVIPGAPANAKAMLSAVTFGSIVTALKEEFQDDQAVIDAVYKIFNGMIKYGQRRTTAIRSMDGVEFLAGKQVALMTDSDPALQGPLFSRGVQVIVYNSDIGLGVVRNSRSNEAVDFRTDSDVVRAVVIAAGEEIGSGDGKWFAHSTGFLFCRGSAKSPAPTRSKVDSHKLVEAVAQAWEEHKAKYNAAKKAAVPHSEE